MATTAEAAEPAFYKSKIRPLLETHCIKCHGAEKQKSNLRLDSLKAMLEGGDGGPAVVPGDLESSRLILAVSYDDADLQMPPDGKLDEGQIAELKKWIEQGSPGE
ncbi:MAG TPA: c-type cytochrome domain-containing protein [Verrucomicrobium sp.]|nr:c-type cytochrome domain-containing protein [Verrucomicrobium sp.]